MAEQRRFVADGKVLRAFMSDKESRVKVIQGPVGSGTSSACCLHIYQQAMAQPKQQDGKQRFRAYVYRETYAKLEETTLKTWLDWFPEKEFGRFYWSKPFRHEIRVGSLELDVIFVAMEDLQDAKSHFKSLEPSIIWFNEGQFADFGVLREAVDRVSPPRYPAIKDGGCVWGGLILDTNAPPADHWIPIMREDVPPPDWMTEEQRQALKKPPNWKFYIQPPGLIEEFDERGGVVGYRANPDAENLVFLPPNFYMEKIGGQTKSWIDANIMNRSAVVVDGRPVYPLFRREVHVATDHLKPIDGLPLIVGLDFGRQPAAMLCQHLRGDWFMQREFIGRDMSAVEFAPQLKTYISQHYPGYDVVLWGDPAGAQRGQANDTTPFDVFRQHGMMVRPAPNPQNKYSIRHEAMNAVLLRRSTSGRASAMVIDPRCTTFITGMAGGYNMRRIKVSGERYADEPTKNQYSHVCFVDGTPVSTPNGPMPIESLMVGDLVSTPLGPRPVRATMTRTADVARYEFSNGASLVCTPDHPFFVENGFCAIEAVEYSDRIGTESSAWNLLFRLRRFAQRRNGRSSPSTVSATIGGPTVISATSALATCTASSGWPLMALSPTPISFTTRTETPPITTSKTWSAWPPMTMSECTWTAWSAEPNPHTTCRAQSWQRQNGVGSIPTAPRLSLKKGNSVWSRIWRWWVNQHWFATTAAANTKALGTFDGQKDFAPSGASLPPGWLVEWIITTAIVLSAAALSACIAITTRKPVRVLAKRSCGQSLVHNVEIDDAHSYYVSGLLVSNCEAGENAVLGGGEGRSVMMAGSKRPAPTNTKTNYNPFKQKAGVRRW